MAAGAGDDFDDRKQAIIEAGHRSYADNLEGMAFDFDYYLSQLDGIYQDSIDIERTADPDCLLVVRCRVVEDIPAVLHAVGQTWREDLAYSYVEAHRSSLQEDGSGQFEFVTQMQPGGMFVTGTVTLQT